jgi:hypothetical protein
MFFNLEGKQEARIEYQMKEILQYSLWSLQRTTVSPTQFQNFLIVLDLPGSMNTASRRDVTSATSFFNTYEEMGVQYQA